MESFPAVRDVCTFGYADEAYGEEVGVAIVISDRGAETLRDLLDWVQARIAVHKIPRRWYLVDEIPRTRAGKLRWVISHVPLDV